MTDGYVASDTWNVDKEIWVELRRCFDAPPDASQMIPVELADELVADPRHVAVI
jgi:hypothetical protein